MPPRSDSVTSSRFERRLPCGKLYRAFRVAFGSDAAAARALRVSKMSIWRWTHDRAPLPKWVAEILPNLVHTKVAEAHEAQDQLRYLLALPPAAPRKLTGACAGLHRRAKSLPVTAEDWAALGD
jgi:hypothetical protein